MACNREKAWSVASSFLSRNGPCQTSLGHKQWNSCHEITWNAKECPLLWNQITVHVRIKCPECCSPNAQRGSYEEPTWVWGLIVTDTLTWHRTVLKMKLWCSSLHPQDLRLNFQRKSMSTSTLNQLFHSGPPIELQNLAAKRCCPKWHLYHLNLPTILNMIVINNTLKMPLFYIFNFFQVSFFPIWNHSYLGYIHIIVKKHLDRREFNHWTTNAKETFRDKINCSGKSDWISFPQKTPVCRKADIVFLNRWNISTENLNKLSLLMCYMS